jgi:hypothetical protein
MNMEALIGNRRVRAAAVAFALLSAGAIATDPAGAWPRWHGALRLAAWAGGFLALLAAVHWSQGIHRRWMTAAGAINVVMTTLLFGACYLLIVPVFWAMIRLRRLGRTTAGDESQWHERRQVDLDLRYFQRMG